MNPWIRGEPKSRPSPKAVKGKQKPDPCSHVELHFERGGLYVVCSNKECGAMWRSVLKPAGIVVNPAARSQGLTEHDVRRKP